MYAGVNSSPILLLCLLLLIDSFWCAGVLSYPSMRRAFSSAPRFVGVSILYIVLKKWTKMEVGCLMSLDADEMATESHRAAYIVAGMRTSGQTAST